VRVTFLGLGQIGGSIARRLHDVDDDLELVAWSPSGAGPRAAMADGIIDRVAGDPLDAAGGADLVVLAAPATRILELLPALAGDHGAAADGPGPTLTDVASTKAAIVAAADGLGLPFVGGHPMAGRETAGYGAADPALFVDRPWVVVPGRASRPVDLERVEWLVGRCGARAIRLEAGAHDAAVAAVSHLPLVLSAALVEAVAASPGADGGSAIRELAAGGWASMTRLAAGDPAMGAAILATNAGPTASAARRLRDVLDGWLTALEANGGPDEAGLRARLEAARRDLRGDRSDGR